MPNVNKNNIKYISADAHVTFTTKQSIVERLNLHPLMIRDILAALSGAIKVEDRGGIQI